MKTIGLVISKDKESEGYPKLPDENENYIGNIMYSPPEPLAMKTIGIIVSKNSKSKGYPKVENEKEHCEYINNVYKALGKPSPYNNGSGKKEK